MKIKKNIINKLNIIGTYGGKSSLDKSRLSQSFQDLFDRSNGQIIGRSTIKTVAPSGNTLVNCEFFQNSSLTNRLLKKFTLQS